MKNHTSECIEFVGARNEQGYGVLPKPVNGSRLAHRAALAESLGRPVIGVARHSCDNPPCINHLHLIEGTQLENIRDAVERGRTKGQFSDVTHCKNGHEFTDENTRMKRNSKVKSGFERVCIACSKSNNRKVSEERKRARHARGLIRNRKVS